MRILMINTVPTEKNGISNVIANLVSSITDKDVHFDLISINRPNQEYQNIIQSQGGKIYVIKRRIQHAFKYIIQLRKVVQKNKYDIVHIHANSRLCVLDLIGAIMGGCKVRIVHSHNTTCVYKRIHMLLMPLFKLLCTGCLACSSEAGKWMFGNMDFKIIRNGILVKKWMFDEEARERIRREYKLEKKIVLGNLAGFVEQKNQTFLINILQELLKSNDQFLLLLMGDGETKNCIEEKVEMMGLSNSVIFTGAIDEGPQFLSACDLYVMPSLFEGFPLALVEAQANGLDCIVSDAITKDTDLTGNLSFLSLNAPVSKWAEKCREKIASENDRLSKSTYAICAISDSGYSISDSAKDLMTYYRRSAYFK